MAETQIETIESVGQDVGLTGNAKRVYEAYVKERFPDAVPDYWREWAERFFAGCAYAASDLIGRALLDHMNFRDSA